MKGREWRGDWLDDHPNMRTSPWLYMKSCWFGERRTKARMAWLSYGANVTGIEKENEGTSGQFVEKLEDKCGDESVSEDEFPSVSTQFLDDAKTGETGVVEEGQVEGGDDQVDEDAVVH